MNASQPSSPTFIGHDRIRETEAAKVCGVSVATLRDWRCRQRLGQPPYFKAGSRVWYSRTRCIAWVHERICHEDTTQA